MEKVCIVEVDILRRCLQIIPEDKLQTLKFRKLRECCNRSLHAEPAFVAVWTAM